MIQAEPFDLELPDGGALRTIFRRAKRTKANGDQYYGFEEREDWKFWNPGIDLVGFDLSEAQKFFNDIFESEKLSYYKKRWLCVNYLNYSFAQCLNPKLQSSTWNYFKFDERKRRMQLVPVSTGVMGELLDGLTYQEEVTKKRYNRETKEWEEYTVLEPKPFLRYFKGSLHRQRFVCYVFWPDEEPGWLLKKRKKYQEKGVSLKVELQELADMPEERVENHTLLGEGEILFFNEWRGFEFYQPLGLQRIKDFELSNAERILSHILDFLFHIVCNSDTLCFEYLKRWHAFIRQNPEKKTEVVPVLMGQQGSGKTFWVEMLFVGLFGSHGHMFAKWQVNIFQK